MTPFAWTPGETRFLDIAGARLETLAFGPPPQAAATLVLLHEGLGSAGLWRDVPLKLVETTGCGVFAYSRQGYGRSSSVALPRPLDYMSREAIEVLPRVLDAIGARNVVLIGHSDGATIAAIHAGCCDAPRLKGIALLAPHVFAEAQGLAAIRAARRAYEGGDLKARLARHHDDADGAFYGWSEAWLDPGFALWNVADCIDRWRVPALAIQGDADPYGTLAQIDEIVARARAVETLILPGVRHQPQFERPAETLAALAGFALSAISGRPAGQKFRAGALDSRPAIASIATPKPRGQS